MEKEDVLEFVGNTLIGIVCPFLFLASDNPHKVLFNGGRRDDENGDYK